MNDKERMIAELQGQINAINQQPQGEGIILDNPDAAKWELDTSVYLDNLKGQLLGKKKVDGVWVDDPTREQLMNDFGVHRMIAELESRISIHMQLSELDKQEIRELTADAGSVYADLLEDNWVVWGVREESLSSELMSIGLMFKDALWILLHIAMKAGMRKHRERRGIKTPMLSQPLQEGAY